MNKVKHTHLLTGRIIAAQEQRFRLETESGNTMLLVIQNGARGAGILNSLVQSKNLVQVVFEGEPNLASGVARRIIQIV